MDESLPRLPGARSPTRPGSSRLPAQPREVALPPAIEVMYPAATLNVGTTDNGDRILQITIIGIPPTVMLFPMSAEAAQEIGARLSAPSVVRASGPVTP